MNEDFREFQKAKLVSAQMTKTIEIIIYVLGCAFLIFLVGAFSAQAWAGTQLPGEDVSGKMEAAGTMLRLLDTALFKWGARIFAGICIMSAAWALKEQRFGIAIICVVGAIVFGTAPTWVKNIFDISDEQSLFSMSQSISVESPFMESAYARLS